MNVLLSAAVLPVRSFGADGPDLGALGSEALGILSEYLKLDTSNPPGSELAAAQYFGTILAREGIPFRILEPVPGRANLYARLKGTGEQPPLVLLQHLDVVPADSDLWSVPPFGGEIRAGAVWGRGALDMKGLGVVHLMTFLALSRSEQPLRRDVILLATADEERGSELGLTWLLDNFQELVSDAGLVLTEGGSNIVRDKRIAYFGVEASQKAPLWLRLTVHGPSGHGAVPPIESAAVRLVRALNRILQLSPAVHVEPQVAAYFREIAPFQQGDLAELLADPDRILSDPSAFVRLSPVQRALVTNTVTLTVLRAGLATNSVPSSATAELDCRLLPSVDPEEFLRQLSDQIGDPAVEIEPILMGSFPVSSPDVELLGTLGIVVERLGMKARVGISVLPGFTDSRQFRARGIPAYGFSPFAVGSWESLGVHSSNERILVDDFRSGLRLFFSLVEELTTKE